MNPKNSPGPWTIQGGNCGAMCGVKDGDGQSILLLGIAASLKAGDVAAVLAVPELIKLLADCEQVFGALANLPPQSITISSRANPEQQQEIRSDTTCATMAKLIRELLTKATDGSALEQYKMRN